METFIVKKVSIVFQVSIAIFTESITFVFVVKNIRPLTEKRQIRLIVSGIMVKFWFCFRM